MNTAILLIIAIPLIEIYLFIKIGSQIGAINTLALILITALLGVWYARFEGFNTLKSGITQLRNNELPVYEIVSGAAITIAAIMLIIPGFATDIFGIILIFLNKCAHRLPLNLTLHNQNNQKRSKVNPQSLIPDRMNS